MSSMYNRPQGVLKVLTNLRKSGAYSRGFFVSRVRCPQISVRTSAFSTQRQAQIVKNVAKREVPTV